MRPAKVDEADNLNLQAALSHARAGRPVFPCSPADKRPAIPKKDGGNGFKDATTDESLIRQWWKRYPLAVPGMPTGAVSGVWVLDVDVKDGKQGEESFSKLRALGPIPDTVEAMTASGGRHLYFLHPNDGRIIPNSASQLGQGHETWGRHGLPSPPFRILPSGKLEVPDIDVRGDGGYVILPGAVMADGRSYTWEGSSDPEEGAEFAPAPPWLLALVVSEPSPTPTASQPDTGKVLTGGRNDHLFRLGRSLRAKGLSEAAIVAALLAENQAVCAPPLDESEVLATARSSANKTTGLSPAYEARKRAAPPPFDPDGNGRKPNLKIAGGRDYDARPEIRVVAGELPLVVDETERILTDQVGGLFQHGTRLVRVGHWESGVANIARPTGAGILVDVTPRWLVDHCTRHIQFMRFDQRSDDWRKMDCPTKVAETIAARTGEWRFPVLSGFCESPTLSLDGRPIITSGYDPPSGLYLIPNMMLPPLGTGGRIGAIRASEILFEAVSTFPFLAPSDRSACLAMIMTALLRRVLPSAPIGCVSATAPASGKSKLVDVISTIATGRAASVAALGHTPEELEKRVDSVLIKGDVLCSFDNVDRPVKSDVLCQITTQSSKSIRVLSLSRIIDVPTNVALFMTGNNLTLIGDLVRRTLVVTLDAGVERPELRVFQRDAIKYVLGKRAELIWAALNISKAYFDAGCPPVASTPFGSFEDWDRMVRRPLIWAGWADPLVAAETMREQDHELTGMITLLRAWKSCLPDPLTSSELAEKIKSRVQSYGEGWVYEHPELHEAALLVLGDDAKWGARDLGYRLRAHVGRIYGGLRITRTRKMNGMTWSVESC